MKGSPEVGGGEESRNRNKKCHRENEIFFKRWGINAVGTEQERKCSKTSLFFIPLHQDLPSRIMQGCLLLLYSQPLFTCTSVKCIVQRHRFAWLVSGPSASPKLELGHEVRANAI